MYSRVDECRAQTQESGSDPALHGALGLLQENRDLFVGVPTEVRELDRGAFAVGDGRQRGTDGFGLGEVEHLALEVVVVARRSERFALLTRATGALGAQEVDRAAVHLGEEERAHRTAVGVVAFGLAPGPNEHFLHDLFGERPIPQDAARECERRRTVALVELGQRALIPADDCRTQRGVVRGPQVALREPCAGHWRCSTPAARLDDAGSGLRLRFGSGCARGIVAHPPTFARMGTAAELRAFIDATAPDGAFPADWNRRLAAAGYVAPHWPRPWGLEASPTDQLAIDEVLRERHVPRPLNPIGIGWAGPTLLVAGTPEQQARYLPGILDGSELWCQLFSEPGAGSDLASLQTRAVRDGDEFVLNGQ